MKYQEQWLWFLNFSLGGFCNLLLSPDRRQYHVLFLRDLVWERQQVLPVAGCSHAAACIGVLPIMSLVNHLVWRYTEDMNVPEHG